MNEQDLDTNLRAEVKIREMSESTFAILMCTVIQREADLCLLEITLNHTPCHHKQYVIKLIEYAGCTLKQ